MSGRHDSGRLIAVWGGYGSPGRTTVAISLAHAFGMTCGSSLLIDADIYGADVCRYFALDGAPSLANAAHRSGRGELGVAMPTLATHVASGFDVLPGIPHPGLWRDLRPAQIGTVLNSALKSYHCVVVDTSTCIEGDGSRSGRNSVTRTVLARADRILFICRADPIGVMSLSVALEELLDDLDIDASRLVVVVNRVPARSAARRMARIRTEIENTSGLSVAAYLNEDPAVLSALWAGRSIQDHAPRARFSRRVSELAEHLGHASAKKESA